MAASATTSQVYVDVIEDVIVKVRDEFVNNGGPGDEVLKELQAMWESKMMQAGVIVGPIERSNGAKPTPGGPITPVHDLNVPYEGNEEYETPTAEMLFPPTPLQTPMQTPLPGTADNSMYHIPTGPSDYSSSGNDTGGNTDLKGGLPSPYMQQQPPSPWMNQRSSLDVNVDIVNAWKKPCRTSSGHPQGSENVMICLHNIMLVDIYLSRMELEILHLDFLKLRHVCGRGIPINAHHTTTKENMLADGEWPACRIPQLDGPIPFDDDVVSTPNQQIGLVLGSKDNYTFKYIIMEECSMKTTTLQIRLLLLVTRTKSRWKCTLKDGIMHINDKDILFNKATGEFDF
ncbi:hypothetical protein Ahy_A08g039138 isoform C [Arachis hypogaea]|uniref:Transcription initiation factor IIA subunit 1 n=1 Tax=Arachis hypogaea TaxID=3818 RepID=A0A445BVU5_ARAHY|nr:hypothetical protein Ahy_A08g039138 isoform C [Arachis hypogaea]